MLLSQLVTMLHGELAGNDTDIGQFVIDGRKSQPGDCYVAIIGENLNGHDYIEQAIANGATSAIVSQEVEYDLPMMKVKDTSLALGQIAAFHRSQFDIPVIALTGSCGKTTVKEMIKSILPNTALVTSGNYNNHIGVPLSLLQLNASHEYAAFELGANHIGEIALTAAWVKPDVSLITLIAPAHLEGFGTIEGVAKTKGEIYEALGPDGIALVNIDDHLVKAQAFQQTLNLITYSVKDLSADLYADDIEAMSNGCYQFRLNYQGQSIFIHLPIPGQHNVANAVAAAAACLVVGFSLLQVKQGLEQFKGVAGRLSIQTGNHGVRLIDDTYNANLSSVMVAIDVLAQYPGQRILVLGELAEVGDALESHYQQIADYAQSKQINQLLTCGQTSKLAAQKFNGSGKHYEQHQDLIQALLPSCTSEATILVKGSRSSKMEEVVQGLI